MWIVLVENFDFPVGATWVDFPANKQSQSINIIRGANKARGKEGCEPNESRKDVSMSQ